ncbi:MAG: AgrB-like protein [Clostridia bacterium]|jgi:accessory gene regulator B|nr:AgrB-like protein [Clostridia bacterium]
MIEKMSQYIVRNILLTDEQSSDDEKEIILFGVTRILEDVPKFIAIFLMCYLLDILKELSVVFAITISYKTFVGGAHARTNWGCFIISSIYFILPIIFAKYFNYSVYLLDILFVLVIIFSLYIIVKMAPADTEEVPIISKKKRNQLKVFGGISITVITFSIIMLIKDITYIKIILYTVFLIDLFATPLAYKLLKCKLGIEAEEFKDLY